VQFQQPLTFLNVGFVSRQIFRVFRVDQEDFHAVFFQNVVKGNPIHAGRLHRHRLDSMTHQPFRQASQILGKAAEFPHMVGIAFRRYRYKMGGVTDIDTGGIRVDDIQAGVVDRSKA